MNIRTILATITICLLATGLYFLPIHAFAERGDGWLEFQKGQYELALKIWKPMAEQGNGDAALGMAILHENGLGVPRNIKKSTRWYEIAADKDIPEAQHDLGIKYFTGSGVKKNNEKAFQLWKAAAEAGLGDAQSKLAYMYNQALGTSRNYDEALRWYRQAIQQNNGEAMYNMSLLYQDGTGVRKDKHQFTYWLNRAADQGYPRAQYDLGLMRMHGIDIERSVFEGKIWLLKAAENQLVDAQYYLGTLYLNGHILAPDRGKAMLFLKQAASQGHQGAQQTLVDIENLTIGNSNKPKAGITIGALPDVARRKMAQKPTPSDVKQINKSPSKPIVLSSNISIQPQTAQDSSADKTRWLLKQSSDSFTIQLFATKDISAAERYINKLAPRLNVFIYSFNKGNQRWHAAATGIYDSYESALAGLKKLPAKERRGKPWVRNIGILKTLINK